MSVTASPHKHAERFLSTLESALAGDPRFSGHARHARPDGSTAATRWQSAANPQVWFEIAVRPLIPQIRVGVVTDDRWKSEDFEEKIEESGDTMSEFVELGFDEAGLEWPEPIVEHYREDMKYFYFATAFEPQSLEALGHEAVINRVRRMFDGYYHAFGPFLK